MKRKRLTITIKKDLLSQVDKKIDGVKIRNRSHAIEYLLTKSLGTKIYKAFVLAGGHGLRMRPFTYEMPKTLIPIKNRPILEYIIEFLKNNGIKTIYLGVDYLSDKIKHHFGDGSKFGVEIIYVENKTPKGTAGALKSAQKYLQNDKFILVHGDVLADIDLIDMIDFSEEEENIITMALTSVDDPSLYGSVRLRGSKVVDFSEKPKLNYRVSRLVNAGMYVVNPQVFKFIPAGKKKLSLEKDIFPKIIKNHQMIGYHFAGQWFDVSSPKNYERAVKEFRVERSN